MGCCIAVTFVIGLVRRAWFVALPGRAPAGMLFAPPARRAAPGEVGPPPERPVVSGARRAGLPLCLGAVAVTTALYAGVVGVMRWTGVVEPATAPQMGWAARGVVLAAVSVIAVAVAAARFDGAVVARTGTAAVLFGAGAAWFGLGVLDMHVFGLFELAPVSVDLAFHGVGVAAMVVGVAARLGRRPARATATGFRAVAS